MVATTQLMLALTKGVVNVGVLLSINFGNYAYHSNLIDHELLCSYLILLYMYLITYTFINFITLLKRIPLMKLTGTIHILCMYVYK